MDMRKAFEAWFKGGFASAECNATSWYTWQAAWQAAQASIATPQPQSVHPDALEALKNYQQADESGVMVLVSRQALDEAIRALIEPLSAADEHQKAVRDLVTYGQSFMVGDKHVPLSDVLLSTATGGQESEAEEPEGWKLVPIEPTKKMIEAARTHYESQAYTGAVSTYKAMLATAPTLDKE